MSEGTVIEPESAEGRLRSQLRVILGGQGSESVEDAARRVVKERDEAGRLLVEALAGRINIYVPAASPTPEPTISLTSKYDAPKPASFGAPTWCRWCGRYGAPYDGLCSECMSDRDL